ncbi:hypothetical protein D3C85_1542040 [compost metagenome]
MPITMNAASQPHIPAISGTQIGARIAPTFAPELKMPVAKERSFFGKYSAVALIAIGKLPASPIASTARDSMKPAIATGMTVRPNALDTAAMPSPIGTAKACMIAPVDQMTIAAT